MQVYGMFCEIACVSGPILVMNHSVGVEIVQTCQYTGLEELMTIASATNG